MPGRTRVSCVQGYIWATVSLPVSCSRGLPWAPLAAAGAPQKEVAISSAFPNNVSGVALLSSTGGCRHGTSVPPAIRFQAASDLRCGGWGEGGSICEVCPRHSPAQGHKSPWMPLKLPAKVLCRETGSRVPPAVPVTSLIKILTEAAAQTSVPCKSHKLS